MRMLAWYCSVLHTNKRTPLDEFSKKKAKDEYRFGSMPVIHFNDGSQMG